jgi:hypothetical protein
LTYHERMQIVVKVPNKIASYNSAFALQHRDLIDSLTRDDYMEYEKILHSWGREHGRINMYTRCRDLNKSTVIVKLAEIRWQDPKAHQKIMNMIRSRWTKIYEIQKKQINNDSDKFWMRMARAIQRRCLTEGYEIYNDWRGEKGLPVLKQWLEDKYHSQNKLCAISKTEMTLTVGEKMSNKCSPDRKNSNKGYTPDNVWMVTSWVNSMKLDTPLITFWDRIDQLYRARNNLTLA